MAVPRKPVAPVTAMRLPARASAITRLSTTAVYHLVSGPPVRRPSATPSASWTPPLDLFAGRGFGATSLDAIAAELGVRKQTILYWFPSKDGCSTPSSSAAPTSWRAPSTAVGARPARRIDAW